MPPLKSRPDLRFVNISPRAVLLVSAVAATATAKLRRKRRGFLFTMPLMLGVGILMFAAMIAISQLFVTVGGPLIPDLLADMPTLFRYDEDGNRTPQYVPVLAGPPSDVAPPGPGTPEDGGAGVGETGDAAAGEFHEEFPSLAMYGLMVHIALGIFVVLLMLAGLSHFFEEFNVVRRGTAYDMVARMIISVPVYMALPYLWDMAALAIESSALYLMDPFGGDPHAVTADLWYAVGSVTCEAGRQDTSYCRVYDIMRKNGLITASAAVQEAQVGPV